MKIKKFTAPTIQQALVAVRNELGENALVLKTKKLPPKGIGGLGKSPGVELTAALDESSAGKAAPTGTTINKNSVYNNKGAKSKQGPEKPPPEFPDQNITKNSTKYKKRENKPKTSADDSGVLKMQEDIKEIKGLLSSIMNENSQPEYTGGYKGSWAVVYNRLLESEVEPGLVHEILKNIKGDRSSPDREINRKFIEVLGNNLPEAAPVKPGGKRPWIVAFVGPTGSGKTTTIAKLASHFLIDQNMNVSALTADTYRVAAIDQIKSFTDIINIGLEIVFSPDDINEALNRCSDSDIVFVDTAGRSRHNNQHMEELKDFLMRLNPDETHLVVSATTKNSDLKEIITRYIDTGIDRLLFTKLDDTNTLGNVYNTLVNYQIPVSYFTSGQCVPDDIEIAQTGRFIKMLWDRSRY